MEMEMLHSAGNALLIILDWQRLLYLFGGVCMGLALGILPGIGGIAGLALLLPFTYNIDTAAAFALLLGMGSTTTTADPISAILFGAPGHAASAATTLDGYPMTRRGEAGRALGASYMSALIGGLFGAALMGFSLPLLRPVILFMGSPELLAIAVFGISMVSSLSGNTPLRGLTAACFGMMLAMIGTDPQTGTLRWTMDSLYLWEGLPIVPVTLGIFALPELCDLAIGRMAVVEKGKTIDTKSGMWLGIKDCLTHWFLILRCSWIGAAMGAIPGIGVAVIDWIAYGHALRTEKGAAQSFGRGDVRGVIAAGAADARDFCAARALRPGDRTHGGRSGRPDDRHQEGHDPRHQGLPDALVPDPALLVARRGARGDPRDRRGGHRLDCLRPRAADREGRRPDLRQGRRARRHRGGMLDQRPRRRPSRPDRRLRRAEQRRHGHSVVRISHSRAGPRT